MLMLAPGELPGSLGFTDATSNSKWPPANDCHEGDDDTWVGWSEPEFPADCALRSVLHASEKIVAQAVAR
jgi:hypothetical protein